MLNCPPISRRGVEQRHVEPALGAVVAKGQAGRAGAHHRDALRGCRGSITSVSWQARGFTRQEVILPPKVWSRQAWLQPMQVLISSARPLRGLAHEVRVGQEGARHRHHVGHALGQHLLGHLGRVDAVGGHQRDAGTLPLSFCVTQANAARGTLVAMVGMRASCQPMPVFRMVTPACLERLRQLHHLVQRGAALDQVEHRQAEDQDEVRPTRSRVRRTISSGKRMRFSKLPPQRRRAGWSARGDELVDQVALGAHDLDAVVAGLTGPARRQRTKSAIVCSTSAVRQRVRAKGADRRLKRAGRDQAGW
jgi:hypothetical protein